MRQTFRYGGTRYTSVRNMRKKGFVLDKKGVRELLQSAEMQTVIEEYTERVQSNAGQGYSHNVKTVNRVVGRVIAESADARRDNNEHNTLLKALHG